MVIRLGQINKLETLEYTYNVKYLSYFKIINFNHKKKLGKHLLNKKKIIKIVYTSCCIFIYLGFIIF